jgi:hypothetical protein
MHDSGVLRRGVVKSRLELFLLFENYEGGVRAKLISLAPRNPPVMPGLDPGIHQSS